jgi:hypothetical protein
MDDIHIKPDKLDTKRLSWKFQITNPKLQTKKVFEEFFLKLSVVLDIVICDYVSELLQVLDNRGFPANHSSPSNQE